MNFSTFQLLLKFYISCIDAEEAKSLALRKNQIGKSFITPHTESSEILFFKDEEKVSFPLPQETWLKFKGENENNNESYIDLHYGFPVFVDNRDMISPLFYREVEAEWKDDELILIPKPSGLSINRCHFKDCDNVDEIIKLIEEKEYGSFSARLEEVKKYLPNLDLDSISSKKPFAPMTSRCWLNSPIIFRSNVSKTNKEVRNDLKWMIKGKSVADSMQKTALGFLTNPLKKNDLTKREKIILEVNQLNSSQEKAVQSSLENPLTVVTGPPGTGKSQVVTSLLASAVFDGQKVLLVSNTNTAIDVVYDRLGAILGKTNNWILKLGNRENINDNKDKVFNLLKLIRGSEYKEKLVSEELDNLHENICQIDDEIRIINKKLDQFNLLQEKINKAQQHEKQKMQALPRSWAKRFNGIPTMVNLDKFNNLKQHSSYSFNFFLYRFIWGIKSFNFKYNLILKDVFIKENYLKPLENSLWAETLENARKRISLIEKHRKWCRAYSIRTALQKQISDFPCAEDKHKLKVKKKELSQNILKSFWLKNTLSDIDKAEDLFKSYTKSQEDFKPGRQDRLADAISRLSLFFPIWTTTSKSAGKILPLKHNIFDLIIIDEASQCDIPSFIPLLYRAKRAVIIGDTNQLRHISSLKGDDENSLLEKSNLSDISEDWSYRDNSIFDRAEKSILSVKDCKVFLSQHYRCHRDIIEYSNEAFYDGQLINQTLLSNIENNNIPNNGGIHWHDIIGNAEHINGSVYNENEVNEVVNTLRGWFEDGLISEDKSFGVITPFKEQKEKIKTAIQDESWFDKIQVDTVHRFQGGECDILIYSPVVSDGISKSTVEWVADQNELINVTVTRAKELLYIVGDFMACTRDYLEGTALSDLANYSERLRNEKRNRINSAGTNKAERDMAKILDKLKLPYVSQFVPKNLKGEYILDFKVTSASGQFYNVEVDGPIHWTAENIAKDRVRDARLKRYEYKILRFPARDVSNGESYIEETLKRIA